MDVYKISLEDGTAKYHQTSSIQGDMSDEEVIGLARVAGTIPEEMAVTGVELFDPNDNVRADFHMTGRFGMPRAAIPEYDINGNIVGIALPNGKSYSIYVVMEERDEENDTYRDLNSTQLEDLDIGILGFDDLNRSITIYK